MVFTTLFFLDAVKLIRETMYFFRNFVIFLAVVTLISCKGSETKYVNLCKEKIQQHIKAQAKSRNGIWSIKHELIDGKLVNNAVGHGNFDIIQIQLSLSGKLSKIIPPQPEYFGNKSSKRYMEKIRIELATEELEQQQEPFRSLGFNLVDSTSNQYLVGCQLNPDERIYIIEGTGKPYGLAILY